MNWVLIAAGAIFVGTVIAGYSRGFLKTIFSMAQWLLTILLVLAVGPMVKSLMMEHTAVYQQTKTGVMSAIESQIADLAELPDGIELPEHLTDFPLPAELEDKLIEKITTTELVQELLKKNNTPENYQALGANSFLEYLGSYLAELVVTVLSFVIAFIVVLIVLQILSLVFDLVGKLPLLGGVNRLAGGLLGAVQGLLLLWLLCLVVTAFPDTALGADVLRQIHESTVLSLIYNNNFILKLVIALGMGLS